MKELKGKKLLILGATSGEISLIQRAQKYGVYVIATDNHTNYEFAPAKKYADEAWDVSWSDIKTLKALCLENHINGVLAGYSEIRVENMIKLCKELNLPCYLNEEQLDITRNKIKFKEYCRKYNIPVVKEYDSINDVDQFPVIVKPTDRAGSIGISIANDYEELVKAYHYALDLSLEKKVIIEQYISDCQKVDFYFWINEGECYLLSSCDTINAKNSKGKNVVQSSWIYPSKKTDAFNNKEFENIKNMIFGMGIKKGCIFFSGFSEDNDEFVFFECGYRLEGGHQYNYTEKRGPINFLDSFIFDALENNCNSISVKPINQNMKCITINIFAKAGIISSIEGIEEIATLPTCTQALQYARVGQECEDDKAILSKVCLISFSSESPDELKENVEYAYRRIKVLDEHGNDMIFDRINTETIPYLWD